MEQLEPVIYEFSAFVPEADGSLSEFSVAISPPESRSNGDIFCRVQCPYFRAEPFTIYGVDHDQALELSRRFVELSLEHRSLKLVDAECGVVRLPPVPRAGA